MVGVTPLGLVAKLADFGMSKYTTCGGNNTPEQDTNSLWWRPPEVFFGKWCAYGTEVDTFAMGVVLTELLLRPLSLVPPWFAAGCCDLSVYDAMVKLLGRPETPEAVSLHEDTDAVVPFSQHMKNMALPDIVARVVHDAVWELLDGMVVDRRRRRPASELSEMWARYCQRAA